MRLVSVAALFLGAAPLVAAEEAEVTGGRRSCIWDEVLRTLRLEQEQSIPFCRKFLTTIIIVSVTVTVSDTTITTQTIRPTYTNVLVKTETTTTTSTSTSSLVNNHALIQRLLAQRNENDDYSDSLVAQYPSSAISSACTCLCIDPVAMVTLASTQSTTTQTIPETLIIDTLTELETVTGPSTTTDTTTTTTTTVVVPPFPTDTFWLRFFVADGSESGSSRMALAQAPDLSEAGQPVLGAVDPALSGNFGDQFLIDSDRPLFGSLSSFGAAIAWYPGDPLNPAAPYEVPFNTKAFVVPPLEALEWTGDSLTYSLVSLTEPSFDIMQLCHFRGTDPLGTWALGAVLGSSVSCTEIPLAVEPRVAVESTYTFNIFYQDSEGVRQYLWPETYPPFGSEPLQLFFTITTDIGPAMAFCISYGHLSFTLDYFFWYYAYFSPSGLFQQAGGGATLIPFNEDGYTCTAFTLGIGTIPMSAMPAPKEDFRIIYTPNGGTEQFPSPVYSFGAPSYMYFTSDNVEYPFLSLDAGGHLKFTSGFQSNTYYAWSANYPKPAGQEWGSQINFDMAADVPDPSYYFQFKETIYANSLSTLTVSSPQGQSIEFRICTNQDGNLAWNAATTGYPLSGCTAVSLQIRPKSWPFRLSWVDAGGQKQYFKFSYFLEEDLLQDSILVATNNVTESALFTTDADRHLWYEVDAPDSPDPVRLLSIQENQPFAQTQPFTLLFRPSPDPSTYVEWEFVNNVLTPVAAPSWNVPQLCPHLLRGEEVSAWAIGTEVSNADGCVGTQLAIEWQLQNV